MTPPKHAPNPVCAHAAYTRRPRLASHAVAHVGGRYAYIPPSGFTHPNKCPLCVHPVCARRAFAHGVMQAIRSLRIPPCFRAAHKHPANPDRTQTQHAVSRNPVRALGGGCPSGTGGWGGVFSYCFTVLNLPERTIVRDGLMNKIQCPKSPRR